MPDEFIGEHHVGDGHALPLADVQELVGCREGVGQHGVVGHHLVAGVGIAVNDEAAADRVVAALLEHCPGVVQGPEGHAVRVGRKGLAPVQHHVLVPVEVHPVVPADPEFGIQGGGRHLVIGCSGVHRLGVLALQSQDHGFVRAVTPAGGAQRTEQFGLHPGRGAQLSVAFESVGEPFGCPHRADRVG